MHHYGVYEETKKIVVSHGGNPAIIAQKDWELKDLGDRAATGKLVLPVTPPVTIYDQRWLLRLASEAYRMAADSWEGDTK